MNVRIMTAEDEGQELTEAMRQALETEGRFRVVQVRGPYANRGDSELVRYYLEVTRQ